MTLKTVLAVFAFALLPGLALAQGCARDHSQSASQCPSGQTWDTTTESCVTPVNS